jgi:hypothetical protein
MDAQILMFAPFFFRMMQKLGGLVQQAKFDP